MNRTQHFLTLLDLDSDTLRRLIERAIELKAMVRRGEVFEPLKNRTLAMVFEKSSTRTRVSFETGMAQFGGHALFLSPRDTQLGRGEPIEDTARVLSEMVDGVMIRTFEHEKIERFAEFSRVPVINALTDRFHPCQLLADMQTWFELRGDIRGAKVAWIGDGNNMCLWPVPKATSRMPTSLPAPATGYASCMMPPRRRAAPIWWSPMSGPAWDRRRNRLAVPRPLPLSRSTAP